MKRSRRYKEIAAKVKKQEYQIDEGVKLLKEVSSAKFDESVEVAMRLGVDPRHADQVVRGVVSLPNGLGKEVRVCAIVRANNEEAAKAAGADFYGFEEILEKIKGGWLDFDVLVATPDVMGELGKLGRVLGPRGLMPNPKSGTVTPKIAEAIKEIKAGKIDFRVDKNGNLHAAIGKTSFDENKIVENLVTFVKTVIKLKPNAAKGTYVKSVTLTSTQGPGIKLTTLGSAYTDR
jgi:large subunit ribosomal protein L1